MATYVAHAGYGKTAPSASESYIDAAELAALYGLEPGEYEVGAKTEVGTNFDADHIHLTPRPDGLYRSIKAELGDNGTDYHIDKMVGAKKFRERNIDREHNVERHSS